jgi:hypothetical protein
VKELPVVCTLTPEALATRKAGQLSALIGRVEAREEAADGWRLRFSAEAWPAIAQTIEAERQCCRFLRFEITVEPDAGPIWLSLTGPPGTHEFLSGLLQTTESQG